MVFSGQHNVLHCPPVANVCIAMYVSSARCLLVLDVESSILYPNNGSQLEIDLVNLAVPALPRIPCDVYPVFVDLPMVTCQTRYTSLEHNTWQDEWASLFSVALGDMTPTVPTKIRRGSKNTLHEYAYVPSKFFSFNLSQNRQQKQSSVYGRKDK